MSLVCTNTESSSFPAGSFHVNGSDGSKFVFRGVAPSGRSARPFLALFGEEKREGTTLEQQETRKTEEKNIIMGVFFRASAVNAKRDDDDDIDALRTNLLFLCRFFFFLSFVHNKTTPTLRSKYYAQHHFFSLSLFVPRRWWCWSRTRIGDDVLFRLPFFTVLSPLSSLSLSLFSRCICNMV